MIMVFIEVALSLQALAMGVIAILMVKAEIREWRQRRCPHTSTFIALEDRFGWASSHPYLVCSKCGSYVPGDPMVPRRKET